MTWEEYKSSTTQDLMYRQMIRTDIECPKCGEKLYYRTDITLTSYPVQYQYECICGFVGYSFKKWSEQ